MKRMKKYSEKNEFIKERRGAIPLLNFEGGPGVPLLNFEEGPGVPLLTLGDPRSHFYTMPKVRA